MIERLVPDSVAVVATREDLSGVELFPEEERVVERAVEKRRREFVTARGCARLALERLGVEPVAIPSGERGEPVWPSGVVGSITHCTGFRACAVARAEDVASVGIDAEVHEPLPAGVLEEVAFGPERAMVAGRGGGVCLDRLLFCAKESIYKAWFPLAGRWLGFEDVELSIDTGGGTFRARLLVPGPVVGGRRLTEFRGRWGVEDGIVAAATIVLP
ncbi:MAG: 4'-phosphopantetheinyl transferase superfamily protein [Actinomycetota bacterium]|nr:4'-phosphopantetheinyl transferase superfamily protein [Actinomycetota bacterium]